MQSLATPAKSQATANVRYPTGRVRVSWKKNLSSDALATVDSSLIDGLDVLAGSATAALPWDTYVYLDETAHVIGFDYDREVREPTGGISGAVIDVVFDNSSDRFTPNMNTTVGTALIPDRPFIVDAGFISGTSRTVPVFKGSTWGDPELDEVRKTARIRAADIITLLEQTTLAAAVYVDQRSDQIIADILSGAGIGSAQYSIDTGLNTIPFAWFPSDMNALRRIRKVCEAEEASFYQDEVGKLRFETRLHYKNYPHTQSQISLTGDDILEFERVINTRIINRVVVEASPRQVDVSDSVIWTTPEEIVVDGNGSKTIWAHPTEADSSVSLLVNSVVAATATTDYTAFTATGGGGANITGDQVVTFTNFVSAVKIVLTNGNASDAYYNLLQFRGKAARVQRAIQAISEDSDSIAKYGVKEYTIDNDFVQTLSWAETLADSLLAKYKDPTSRLRLRIPALPHLQLKDRIQVRDPSTDTDSDYRVMRISGKFVPGLFTQDLIVREIDSSETAT